MSELSQCSKCNSIINIENVIFPTEIHEVAEIKMTAIKLKEYQNASCKNILWILTKAPLLKSFDVVRNLYTDQDNYLNDNLLTGRGRRD